MRVLERNVLRSRISNLHMKNLGDKIAAVAQPIAKGIDSVLGTNIQGCAGCKQMQQNLNAGMPLSHAFYNRFWSKKEGGNMEEYIVNKNQNEQYAITANNPREAIEKVKSGEGAVIGTSENYNASVRPKPQGQ
jgi:hypothetical protein